MSKIFLVVTILIVASSCAFRSVHRHKDITYTDSNANLPTKQLDVYAPKKADNLPVMVFFYGGSWESGEKKIYNFLGNRLARREVIVVVADYPLASEYTIPSMQEAALEAVNWTKDHIADFGGDTDRIFVSGHSAGGHLASLIAVKEAELAPSENGNKLAGSILIDAAGLDMYSYLQETGKGEGKKYLNAFTDDPAVWKEYSPMYFLTDDLSPMLILEGERTYPSIQGSRERFMKRVGEVGIEDVTVKIYPKKKHIPMITQFLWTPGRVYRDVLGFIEDN
ncbi:acetyl esterase/lipase [Algoriphagus ratkowskyi]|uniref:Acetyl esterase/lipase n=1 Tax=Algoriphagus ratkowskyi TaxID=57028 RepID=A0A2W7S3U2_9BACT|nr:alpha/beta hydrolase [Algoriphagus ratkowskyi]PZX57705.1 acetyl esterase/lipase [Algoriphagus ratkowskyi]TXD78975.1 alpha/beta hydrolase [Algoriphagus ratkowskyi]